MNKIELAKKISETKDITIKEATADVELMLGFIEAELVECNDVALYGFGSLKVATRKARICRNPKDGSEVKVPEKKVVKFTMAKGLKDKVNK